MTRRGEGRVKLKFDSDVASRLRNPMSLIFYNESILEFADSRRFLYV